jgi:hypothetical protein
MKYAWETEEQFKQRQKEAKARGECVFRDDAEREMILDLIYDYMDIIDAVNEQETTNVKR